MAPEEGQTTPEEEQVEEAPVDDDPAGIKALGTFAEQVRSSARWLIGAFAAVGALLVPGLGLANVGSLEGWRQAVAIAAVAVAVLVAIASVAIIVRFLSPGRTSLAELAERETKKGADDDLIAYFHRNKGLLQGQADSLADLHQRYMKARKRLSAAEEAASADTTPDPVALAQAELDAITEVAETVLAVARLQGPADLSLTELANAGSVEADPTRASAALEYLAQHPEFLSGLRSVGELRAQLVKAHEALAAAEAHLADKEAEAGESVELARTRLEVIEQPIAQIEAVAEYQDLRLPFLKQRWLVAVATFVVAASMAAFAVASHEPERSKSDLSGRTLTNLDLSGTKLEDADLSETTFQDSNLTGADLDGADLDGTRFIRTRCPSGQLSETVGGTCRGKHLKRPVVKPPVLKPTGLVSPRDEPRRG